MGASAMRPGGGMRLARTRSSRARAPGPVNPCLAKPVVSMRPTPVRTARTSSATTSKALERWKVTSSVGSAPGRWNHRAVSSPYDEPHTALRSVRRPWIGDVWSGRPAGNSSLGNEMENRRL